MCVKVKEATRPKTLVAWSFSSDRSAIREQLDRLLKSGPFEQSQRRQQVLEYLVDEMSAGATGCNRT